MTLRSLGPGNVLVGAVAVVLSAGLTACGSSTSTSPATTSGPPHASPHSSARSSAAAVITIQDFKYRVPKSVAPGATVTVRNTDSVGHTVTSDRSGVFSVQVTNGGTASFIAPRKSGSYKFHCTIHPSMHGVLVVG